MPPRKRLLYGLGCLWPLIYVLVFLVIPATRRFFFELGWTVPQQSVTWLGAGAFLVQVATLLLTGTMVVLCIIHVSEAKHVPEEERLPWTILLVLANVLTLPLYWLLYVRTSVERTTPGDLYPRRR